jgi:hypothetical protein
MIRLFDRIGERFAVGVLKGANWVLRELTMSLVKRKRNKEKENGNFRKDQ